jgi:adaptin ear-binding coat-associated protein 1/2
MSNDLNLSLSRDFSSLEFETFKNQAGEAYVYATIPPATLTGHYASKWNNLDDWDAIVTCKLFTTASVTDTTRATIRLFTVPPDNNTPSELFAECPLPLDFDKIPLSTAVEPVTDSSRYFVLRLVDAKRHAFVGLGFRERQDASNFNAALVDYIQFVRRQKQVQHIKDNNNSNKSEVEGGGSDGHREEEEEEEDSSSYIFKLKPNEKLILKIASTSGKSSQCISHEDSDNDDKSGGKLGGGGGGGFVTSGRISDKMKKMTLTPAMMTGNNSKKENEGNNDDSDDYWGEFVS